MKWWIPVLAAGIVAVAGGMSGEGSWQGVLDAALWGAEGLFFLKIAWNVLIPFSLARRERDARPGERAGISLMPCVEIGLWLVWLLLAFFAGGDGWLHSPKTVAVCGGGAIPASYALMFAVGGLSGWSVMLRAKENRAKTAGEAENGGSGKNIP